MCTLLTLLERHVIVFLQRLKGRAIVRHVTTATPDTTPPAERFRLSELPHRRRRPRFRSGTEDRGCPGRGGRARPTHAAARDTMLRELLLLLLVLRLRRP